MSDDDTLKPQTTVKDYAIKRVLGRGSFGITYLAEDINHHYAVAVKEFFPADIAERGPDSTTVNVGRSKEDAGTEFQSGLDKFLEESRILGGFQSPHIVRVVDTFELNGTAYMVMQYEEGGTLARYLNAHEKPLDESQILGIFVPVLEGLKDVHAKWLLHRDVKPDNIYIRKDGSPLLIDFGTARHALSSKHGGMTEYLTVGYAPPEQYDRMDDHGPWTDVYAVGATMYYCVTRIRPPESRRRVAGRDPVMPAVQAAPGFYDKRLLKIIDWMMTPNAEDRSQSVDEVLTRLRALESGDVETMEEGQEDLSSKMASAENATDVDADAEAGNEPDARETVARGERESKPAGEPAVKVAEKPDQANERNDGHGKLVVDVDVDAVTWIVCGVVAVVTLVIGIVNEYMAAFVNNLGIVPAATLALAVLRPLRPLIIALLAVALQSVALVGYMLGGGGFEGSAAETAALALILSANAGLCALVSYLAHRFRRKRGEQMSSAE